MALTFQHRFQAARELGGRPLLLLHGTGGNEDDLIPLGELLAPGAALLSPRGRVLERGMPRFFARSGEGVFDPAEIRARVHELADFVGDARQAYGLPVPIAVGLSNGANVAGAMLALRPETLAGAILLRPMSVLEDAAAPLPGISVLILSGATDPIVPVGSAERLAGRLGAAGAVVTRHVLPGGHGLLPQDVRLGRDWLATVFAPRVDTDNG